MSLPWHPYDFKELMPSKCLINRNYNTETRKKKCSDSLFACQCVQKAQVRFWNNFDGWKKENLNPKYFS